MNGRSLPHDLLLCGVLSGIEKEPGLMERREVFPIPKATRPWSCRYDNPTCIRSAKCPRCRGYAARMKGQRKQREARKKLNVPKGHYWGEMAHEEAWRAWARIEVKSGSQVKGVATRYLAAENQAPAILGDLRPFLFVAMPDGWGSEGLAVVRLSVLASLVELALHGSTPPTSDGPSPHDAPHDVLTPR